MSVLHLILLILGVLLILAGVVSMVRIRNIALWPVVEIVVGLILLAYGGFISA